MHLHRRSLPGSLMHELPSLAKRLVARELSVFPSSSVSKEIEERSRKFRIVLSSGRVLGLRDLLDHKLTHLLVETLHFLRMNSFSTCNQRRRFDPSSSARRCSSSLHTFYDPCHLLLHCISLIGMLIGVTLSCSSGQLPTPR